jgi:hypothetical protein
MGSWYILPVRPEDRALLESNLSALAAVEDVVQRHPGPDGVADGSPGGEQGYHCRLNRPG